MARYKQRCSVCKKNWSLVTSYRQRFVVCIPCEMQEIMKPIKDAKFKKLFALPLELYKENSFLRSVRYQYGRFGSITERQLEAFKKTVKELMKKTSI